MCPTVVAAISVGADIRPIETFVSACAILVIFWGGVLISHHLRRTDLNHEFQKINHRYFADGLHGVRVEYAVLEQNDGETRKYSDDDFLILVDTSKGPGLNVPAF
jgi:hypothetical protein